MYPSSQAVGHQDSNIPGRLEIYNKPGYDISGSHLEEEGQSIDYHNPELNFNAVNKSNYREPLNS